MSIVLILNQFGAFRVFRKDGADIALGAKHQALLALLSTSSSGIRTRAFLEHTLWSLAQPEQAKASLRTALSTLKRHLGAEAAQVLTANRERVMLDLSRVHFSEQDDADEFMEGFELPHEAKFAEWLEQTRAEFKTQGRQADKEDAPTSSEQWRVRFDDLLPSIAVLPFAQKAPTGDGAPLGSLIAEELSRCLARSQAFSVTSYLASRQFDPAKVRPNEVSNIAGVRYLVSGSIYLRGTAIHADIELHDASRERVIWARSFEGNLTDLLEGRSDPLFEVTRQIAQTLIGEAVRLASFKPLSSLEGHTLLSAAISQMQDMNEENFSKARKILVALLDREPQHPLALTWMGFWHVLRVQKGFSRDHQLDAQLATQLAQSALNADSSFSLAHTLVGVIASHLKFRFDLAQSAYDLALKDNPNEAMALLMKGSTSAFLNETEKAIALTDKARRLSPLGPQRYYFDSESAIANLAAGDYKRAVHLADRSLLANASYPASLRTKAIALQKMGRVSEARDTVNNLMRVNPSFNLARMKKESPALAGVQGGEWIAALREAGVPN